MKCMKTRTAPLTALILTALMMILSGTAFAETPQPRVGGTLPEIILDAPLDPVHLEYLSLAPDEPFGVLDIDAEVIVIQIFSMYCPHCQREAPDVNRLFKRITKNELLNKNVRFLGIGVGNSAFEVEVFRKKYGVEFPLLPDSDFTVHKQLGEVRTPFFIGVKKDGENGHGIFLAHLGGIKDQADFLKKLAEQVSR